MHKCIGIKTRQRVFDVVAVDGGAVCSTIRVTVADDESGEVISGSRIAFYEECFGPVVLRERDEEVPELLRSVYGRRGGRALSVRRVYA